jgi:hypothetical protein
VTVGRDRLWREVSYVALHFHWSLDDILDLEHPVRRRFVEEITVLRAGQPHVDPGGS